MEWMSGFDLSHVFCFNVHCTSLFVTHPWCASGNALTYHWARVSTWWNTILCQWTSLFEHRRTNLVSRHTCVYGRRDRDQRISSITMHGIKQMDILTYSCPRYASKLGYRGSSCQVQEIPCGVLKQWRGALNKYC